MRSLFLIALLVFTLVSAKHRQAKRERREACSRHYSGLTGVITSHPEYGRRNYDISFDCIYTIDTGPNATVSISIVDIDIEWGGNCYYDSLTIGLNTTNPKKLCGTQRRTFIYNNVQGSLVMEFKSDFSQTGRGFKISYRVKKSPCLTYKEDFGVITSPGYGLTNEYANNLNCEYAIETGAGKAEVNLVLKHFDVESASGCVYDYLQIVAPHNQSQKLCGFKSAGTTYTYRDVEGGMMLKFHSDRSIGLTGFSLEFRVFRNNNTTPSWNITDPSWNSTIPSWNNTIPSWNNTIPSWNNTIPSWNNTIPSWNNTTPSWNNTNPSSNSTIPSGNYSIPSLNNSTRPFGNQTVILF